MLTEVKRHIQFIFICAKYNLAREMENRMAFIMQVAGMMLNNGIMIIQWVILFSINGRIGGYAFQDVILLWALSASSFGVAHTLFFNTLLLPSYIVGGKLDAYLVQPKQVLVNVASSKMSVSAVGDVLYGLLLVILLRVGVIGFLLFIFFMITGGLIMASFYTISGSLAFWIVHSEDVSASLNTLMISFGTYPEGLFNGTAKWLLFTVIPIGFAVYVPIRVFRDFDWVLLLCVLGFTVLIMLLAFFVFHRGLKKYSSSNLMSARI